MLKSQIIAAAALAAVCAFASAAQAATDRFTFDATLTSGSLNCGTQGVGSEVPCPSLFGVIDGTSPLDDLMLGMSIGSTYQGQIDLVYDNVGGSNVLVDANCFLNGKNCAYDTAFLPLGSPPLGADPGTLDFTTGTASVESLFNIAGGSGTYSYSTDYLFTPGMVYYYFDVEFDLSNVVVSEVPLPASMPILLMSLLGLGAVGWHRRR